MFAVFCGPIAAFANPITINTEKINWFHNQSVGEPVGNQLVWKGGLKLWSENRKFGGLSDLTFTSSDTHFVMVTDTGYFVSGQFTVDDDASFRSIKGATIRRIKNSKGVRLPSIFSRDPEAIDTLFRDGKPVAVRVGFEHLTRAADFALTQASADGAAKEYGIPSWLAAQRHNESIESLCIAPPASPVAGSTLFITEDVLDGSDNKRAWLSGKRDGGDLLVKGDGGYRPTGCAFLPDGDLLVLYRDVGIFGFTMKLKRIAAEKVQAGALLDGVVLLEAGGGDVDNMEGIATYVGQDGEINISILSDDNFNGWQRSLILNFVLVK